LYTSTPLAHVLTEWEVKYPCPTITTIRDGSGAVSIASFSADIASMSSCLYAHLDSNIVPESE
jgi:hypothetical protein